MRHYAHEVMQGKKETLAQMKGMQRKSIERATAAEFVRLFWLCSSTSDPVCDHRDKQVITMRARTTDHDLILLKRPSSVLPSEPRSSFPSHLHLRGHERTQMRPDKTKEPDRKLTETN